MHKYFITGFDYGLFLYRHKAIIKANDDILSTEPQKNISVKLYSKCKYFISSDCIFKCTLQKFAIIPSPKWQMKYLPVTQGMKYKNTHVIIAFTSIC